MTRKNRTIGILFTILLFLVVLYYFIHYIRANRNREGFYDGINDDYVFMMTRHVNSKTTDEYWKESYRNIRKTYPDKKIVIIDDNSNKEFLKNDIELVNTEIIKSEFPGRGELLPYYYFYKNKYSKKAVIIHDSVFFKEFIDFDSIGQEVLPFWHYTHEFDLPDREKELIGYMDNSKELLDFYDDKDKWQMTFGVMSMIQYPFLDKIQKKYNFFKLLDVIKNRTDRMCLERIFGLICHKEYSRLIERSSFFGFPSNWGYTFERYLEDIRDNVNADPVIKVWTGR
jgi:hypothetical protein